MYKDVSLYLGAGDRNQLLSCLHLRMTPEFQQEGPMMRNRLPDRNDHGILTPFRNVQIPDEYTDPPVATIPVRNELVFMRLLGIMSLKISLTVVPRRGLKDSFLVSFWE